MEHPDILEIRNLSIVFRSGEEETTAVDKLCFTLKKGMTMGIVGESGSGKSVTALSILRLLPEPQAVVSADKILLHGAHGNTVNLTDIPERQMRNIRGNRISMIFQEPMTSLNPVMRCGKQVVEAILAHRDISRKEAKIMTVELFREVQLPRPEDIFSSYPHELSGGQKQRVMTAMAIASEPDILIADEPTTALDVTVQKNIIRLLKDLQARYNMAILFITHDLGLISTIADDILVMKNGKIVESGPVDKIFHSPQHPYTKGLIACRPGLGTSPERLQTVEKYSEKPNPRDEVKYRAKLEGIYKHNPLLEAVSLTKSFPVRGIKKGKKEVLTAVDNVSLKVFPGEVLGLVGESGCGKTTLGRSILRLIEPTEGRVIFNGIDLTNLTGSALKKLRKDIQIIFQDPYSSLNPRISVGSAIMEPMIVHNLGNSFKERKAETIDLLRKVGLGEKYFRRYPHELSGGQRQRVCIARALAVKPKFIVCDESVSALDVSIQAQVLNLLKDLQEEFNFTYIFISHDLSVVNFISDRVAVMKDGKIVETGTPGEVFHSPKTDHTRKLIDAIPS